MVRQSVYEGIDGARTPGGEGDTKRGLASNSPPASPDNSLFSISPAPRIVAHHILACTYSPEYWHSSTSLYIARNFSVLAHPPGVFPLSRLGNPRSDPAFVLEMKLVLPYPFDIRPSAGLDLQLI